MTNPKTHRQYLHHRAMWAAAYWECLMMERDVTLLPFVNPRQLCIDFI